MKPKISSSNDNNFIDEAPDPTRFNSSDFKNVGDGGGGSSMEPRIAALEAHMEHVKKDISDIKSGINDIKLDIKSGINDIKSDISKTRTDGFKAIGFVILLLAGAYGMVDSKIEKIYSQFVEVTKTNIENSSKIELLLTRKK